MKILRIRFQNLNSLKGIWEIDFSSSAYAENSLFAIVGPTGAGKSTLLDALCLALYGATPRLGKITKASNQIMSRHTGVCFAEVEFSTIKGRFRCHWSQHRSRLASHGELQQAKHEITDASSDTLLESLVRNVTTKVEEVTGMDFDRFTRSTLLAQGGFAAFLEASADKRSPILEQITGTEIYSRLSIKVHELRLLEQNKLNELEQTLSHIKLLNPEDEAELQKSIGETDKNIADVKTLVATFRIQLQWAMNIAKLESEHKTFSEQLEALHKDRKKHTEYLNALGPALAAKEIEPLYLAKEHLITSQKEALKEKNDLTEKGNALEATKKTVILATEAAEKSLQQAEISRKIGLEQIRAVEQLDQTLHNTQKILQEQSDTLHAHRKTEKTEHSALNVLKQRLLQAQNEKTVLGTFLKEHAEDEKLFEEYGAIELIIHRLTDLYHDLDNITQAGDAAKHALQAKEQTLTALRKERDVVRTQLTASIDTHSGIQKKIAGLLEGHDFSELQQKLFRTQIHQKSVQELTLLLEQLSSHTTDATIFNKLIFTLSAESNESKQQLSLKYKEQIHKQQEVDLLEKNLLLLLRIQTLEEDRRQLKDDVPCPLCGSTNHPYNHGNIPTPSQEEKRLNIVQKELQVLGEQIETLTRQEIIANEKKASLTGQLEKTKATLLKITKTAEQLLSNLELPPLTEIQLEQLQQESLRLGETIRKLSADREQLEKLHKNLNSAIAGKETLTLTTGTLEKELLTAEHNLSSAKTEQQRLSEQAEKLSKSLTLLSDELGQTIRLYGNFVIGNKHLPLILTELKQRMDIWKTKKVEEMDLDPKLISLAAERDHKEILRTEKNKQITDQEALCTITQQHFDEIQQQRRTLFGNKKTKEEEARLEQMVTDARKVYTQLQGKSGYIDNKITAISTLQNRIQEDATAREKDIATQQQLFSTALTNSPFSSSEQFIAAKRSPQELLRLQTLQSKLQEKEKELTTLINEKSTSLQLERKKQICKETVPEVNTYLVDQEKQLEDLQAAAITAKEQLKRNSRDKKQSAEQLTVITSQKKEVSRWNTLHMLIGSADGKKFRNFAQGLTFEMMVHHANNHLRKMSDRYILVRDTTQPLDLNVIDTYQADEIRSTKNLSGGESFLVSLALALGLSKMASHNVRVDSLFLDEGFGTLDEDALESALETLAQLREENKLIGIISHVGALKERIPLQIEIIPGSRGNSIITGPGVTGEA